MISNNPRGAILLYTLLMTGIITIATFVAVEALRRGAKGASNFGRAAIAQAANDGGLEDALYHLRQTVARLQNHEKFTVGAVAVARSVTYGETSHTEILAPGATYDFGMYDPLLPPGAGGVEALRFSWTDDCEGASTVEVRWLDWQPGQIIDWDAKKGITKYKLPFAFSPAKFTDFSAAKTYRVRVQPLACTAIVTVDGAADDAFKAPGRIQTATLIDSIVNLGDVSQDLQIKTLRAEDLPVKD